jgi:hypothetical protein
VLAVRFRVFLKSMVATPAASVPGMPWPPGSDETSCPSTYTCVSSSPKPAIW